MKLHHLLIVIGSFVLLAAGRAAEPDLARLEQVALAELKASNTPGAAVGIVRDGEFLWKRGLGLANVEAGQAVDPAMLFRLGSTTKMFTAAALVSLTEEGKLQLDEPLSKCVPNLHPGIAKLTPHHLLTHSAGLTDESMMSGRHDDEALAANARTMDQTWLFAEPGQIFSYSNPGYWLAGLTAEQISGKPYADVMDERLFRPLGMERTTLRPLMAMSWPLALGHEVRSGKPHVVRPQADNAATRPAGQMYSNLIDLARFTTAFMDGGKLEGKQVISTTLITKLTSPHVPCPGDDDHYGYGLRVGQQRGVTIWQHGGSRTGYGSTICMAPEQKTAVIVLTNRTGSSLPRTTAVALEMLLPYQAAPNATTAKPEPLTEQQMAELAGVYSNNRQTIELLHRDGQLTARRSGAESSNSPGTFSWSGENRLALYASEDASRPTTSFFVRRDSAGRPEFLINGSRALRRQP